MKVDLSRKTLEDQKVFAFVDELESNPRLVQKEREEENQIKEEKVLSLEPAKTREFAEALNRLFQAFNLELRLTVHEPTREIIARIVNRQTGEVIREIPPERFLDMIAKLREMVGVLLDEIV